MARLRRFESHRFVGARDTMVVYDCDDAGDFAELEGRASSHDLFRHNLLQTFAPDEMAEARNRGFTPRQ